MKRIYERGELVGKGGMAEVYEGTERSIADGAVGFERKVALKYMKDVDGRMLRSLQDNFRQEA